MNIENFNDITIKSHFHKYDQVILDQGREIKALKDIVFKLSRRMELLEANQFRVSSIVDDGSFDLGLY